MEILIFLDDTYKFKAKVGNDEVVEVKGRGTVSISIESGIKIIPGVLYTPNMIQNLLSVGQMLENNYLLHFMNRECVVSDISGVKLFCAKMSNKIFLVVLGENNLACLHYYFTNMYKTMTQKV